MASASGHQSPLGETAPPCGILRMLKVGCSADGPTHPSSDLNESAKASDGLAYDHRVHLARAFIRIDGLGVGDETADVVLKQDAVAPQELTRIADRFAALDCRESLGK